MAITEPEEFERIARQSRIAMGIEDYFCPDMIYALSDLKRRGKIADYLRIADDQMPNEAHYDGTTRVLRIRATVFDILDGRDRGSKRERRRARFTIAHEIGHVEFGHEGGFRGVASEAAIRLGARRVRPLEREANQFGAAFLAPLHLAQAAMRSLGRKSFSPDHFSELFDINVSAAELRLETIEKLERRARGGVRPLPDGIADWLRGQKAKGYAVTSLERDDAQKRANAIANGYEGQACLDCARFTLVRVGVALVCETCGWDSERD